MAIRMQCITTLSHAHYSDRPFLPSILQALLTPYQSGKYLFTQGWLDYFDVFFLRMPTHDLIFSAKKVHLEHAPESGPFFSARISWILCTSEVPWCKQVKGVQQNGRFQCDNSVTECSNIYIYTHIHTYIMCI